MSNTRYELAVFDIDGVLNEHGGNIIEESIEAIKLLRTRGLRVCFASGKHAWYVHGGLIWSGLMDSDTLIVAENGGVVYNPKTRRTIYEDIYLNDVRVLKNIFHNLHSSDRGFARFAGLTVWEEPKETLFCLYPKDTLEVNKLSKVLTEIVSLNKLNLSIIENPDSVDVLQAGINKATGLNKLCEWLNIDMKQIIAFGDSYNDTEMLSEVGLPVTVSNGVDTIKKIVLSRKGLVADARSGKGVLEIVNKLMKNNTI